MKTYQLIDTIYREYFIEANSKAEAIEKMIAGDIKPAEEWSDDRVEVVDIHDGNDWAIEPTRRAEQLAKQVFGFRGE